jgi:hypothetical protein
MCFHAEEIMRADITSHMTHQNVPFYVKRNDFRKKRLLVIALIARHCTFEQSLARAVAGAVAGAGRNGFNKWLIKVFFCIHVVCDSDDVSS